MFEKESKEYKHPENNIPKIKMETKWIIMLIVMIIAVIAGLWIKAKIDEQALAA